MRGAYPSRWRFDLVWINVSWFLVKGLRRYNLHAQADRLTERTLALVRKGGFLEYLKPAHRRGLRCQELQLDRGAGGGPDP